MKTCFAFILLFSITLNLSIPHHFNDQYSKNGQEISKQLINEYDLEDIEILEKIEKNSNELTS